ncbi:MAG: hypothetical protein QX198_09165 [Methylococcaceae bacterium]
MQAVLTQIATLQATLTEEQSKSHRNLLIISGIYAVMTIWTIWDTSHVLGQIKEVSSPDKVAMMASNQLRQKLPGLQQDLIVHMQQTAPQIAERLIQSAHQTVPATGKQVKQQLSAAADELALRMDQRTPAITEFLKANLKDTIPAAHYASDEELSKALVGETVKALDQELTLALNPTLFNALLNIKSDIDLLVSTPEASLTAQQRVEKTALLNALRISNMARGDTQSSLLAQGLRAILQAGLPSDMFKALDSPVVP